MNQLFKITPYLLAVQVLLTSCKSGITKETFQKEVDRINVNHLTDVEYRYTSKINYLGIDSESHRDYDASYDEEHQGWCYPIDDYDPELVAYLYIPNIKIESELTIFESFSPHLSADEYKVSFAYSTRPLSFTSKIKGINKQGLDYKDYTGKMYCEFNENGWLIYMTAYFERYMIKTDSKLIEDIELFVTFK